MKIATTNNGFAVQNEDGSYVGFAATLEIADQIKARAEASARALAEWEAQAERSAWVD